MNEKSLSLFNRQVLRPAWLEIDLDAVAANLRNIKNYLQETRLLAVVKADAYGLGAVPVARLLAQEGVDILGVVMPDEALELRNAGITAPILNMGAFLPTHVPLLVEHNIEQTVYKIDDALALSRAAAAAGTTATVHFKIDTGMSRYGVHYSEAVETYLKIASFPNIRVAGIMTHFPKSDAIDKSYALLQIERMKNIRKQLKQRGIDVPLWHLANSGGTLDLPEARFNMVRVGLMLYGYFPSSDVRRPFDLVPAMSLKRKLSTSNISIAETPWAMAAALSRKRMNASPSFPSATRTAMTASSRASARY